MSQRVSFNLIDEPWVRIRDEGGIAREVSLLELFEQAPNITCLANDLPTQDFAILRVLLAILQRAIAPILDEDDDPTEIWGRLWNESELPLTEIREYLHTWHDRFDILDEEKPFLQVPGLQWEEERKSESTKSNLKLIIADVPSRDEKRLFTQRVGGGLKRLSYPEAARWLIHVQAFDVSSPGRPVEGEDPTSVKKGKVYPGSTGWMGELGGIYLEGTDFRKTLLLNFLPTLDSEYDELFDIEDLPAWEVLPPAVSDGHCESLPSGRAGLYSWQSRWVRLIAGDDCVCDVVITAGNKIKKDYRYLAQYETMTAWKEKASINHSCEIRPNLHQPEKALWRGLSSVFGGRFEDNKTFRQPEVLSWAEHCYPMIAKDEIVNLRAVGFRYKGDQKSTYDYLYNDYLEMSPFLLSEEGKSLLLLARNCASETETAIGALGQFAIDLCVAAGAHSGSGNAKRSETSSARSSAIKRAYFQIDRPFREWLSALCRISEAGVERSRWRREAREVLSRIEQEMLSECESDSVVGRPVRDEDGNVVGWMSAPRADMKFKTKMKKALPLEEDRIDEKDVH